MSFMALDLLLHVLVLHHVMQFWNFYLLFLSVSQCQGIAPCYATLELGLGMTVCMYVPYHYEFQLMDLSFKNSITWCNTLTL